MSETINEKIERWKTEYGVDLSESRRLELLLSDTIMSAIIEKYKDHEELLAYMSRSIEVCRFIISLNNELNPEKKID